MATVEERLAALETWRTAVVAPALAQGATRLTAIETLADRIRRVWKELRFGRLETLEGEAGLFDRMQPMLAPEVMEALAWLVQERRKARPQ